MIKINCVTADTMLLKDMVPFQGNLKKRTERDYEDMRASLLNDGLMTPFFIWKDRGYILDGHCRREALAGLNDPEITNQLFPVMYINADTEEDARKAVVQICSIYGKINKRGLRDFTAPISNYKAPLIKRGGIAARITAPVTDKCIVRLRVPKAELNNLIGFLKQLKYVEFY